MADKRIYDLTTTTALTGKYFAVDVATNAEAEKFDAGQIVTLSGSQTISGSKTLTAPLNFGSASAYITRVGSDLVFTDLNAGSKTLSELAAPGVAFGSGGEIPYMNGAGTDFIYSSALNYTTGVLTTSALTVSSLAAVATPQLVTADVATGAFKTWTALTYNNSTGVFTATKVNTTIYQIVDATTQIEKDGSNNMTFTDAVTGTKTLAQLAALGISLGSSGQIPYMNAGGTDFSYTSGLTYTTGVLTTSNLKIQALAADGALLFSVVATGDVTQSSNLTFSGSTLTVTGAATVTGLITGGSLLLSGATVDTIETTLTNDDTHLATSGAVYDAIAALIIPTIGATEKQIPWVNPTATDFSYASTFIYDYSTNTLEVYKIKLGTTPPGTSATVDNIETTLTNTATSIATSSAIYAAIGAVFSPSLGTSGQIPYMNSGGTDFAYSSALTYATGILTTSALTIQSLAADGALLYSVVATGAVTQSSNLTFNGSTLTVTGAISVTGLVSAGSVSTTGSINGGDINATGSLTGNDLELSAGAVVDTIETTLTNDDTRVPTSGAVYDSIAALSIPSLGSAWQIPYMNSGGTDFAYTSSLRYETGALITSALTIQSLASDGALLYSVVATGVVTQSSNLTFDGSTLSITGAVTATGLITGGSLKLGAGATVNYIETTLTNNSSRLATSSAIYAAIAAVGSPSYGSSGQIPYMNAGGTDFIYSSALTYATGILTTSNLTVSALAASSVNQIVLTTVATGVITTSTSFKFDGNDLLIGSGNAAYYGTNHTYSVSVQANTLNTRSALELGGYFTADNNVAYISFHNYASTATGKRIALVVANRDGDDDAGKLIFYTANTAGTLNNNMEIDAAGNVSISNGVLGVNSAFNSTVGVIIGGNTSIVNAISYTNYNTTFTAWTDFPTALPSDNRLIVGSNASTVYGSGHYMSIMLNARGNSAGGANAWALVAVEALSTTNHSTGINFLLRGPGVSDYSTLFKIQSSSTSNAQFYWQVESSAGDITHRLTTATTDRFTLGYDASNTAFQITSGSAFAAFTTAAFSITTGHVFYMDLQQITTSTNYIRWDSASNQVGWYSSDKNSKHDIVDLDDDALAKLSKFNPVRFKWNKDDNPEIGWIAQDGKPHIPEMFPKHGKYDLLTLNEYAILPYYHKAIQQLLKRIEDLEAGLN